VGRGLRARDGLKIFITLGWVTLAAILAVAPEASAQSGQTLAGAVTVSAKTAAWTPTSDYESAQRPEPQVNADGTASSASVQIAQQVEARLKENLSPELFQNFGLFIYVSKADVGPWAQRMYVFQKVGDDLLPLYDWPVSTGREAVEADAQGVELPTTTPTGYYELDGKRLFEKYRSTQWNESMPYAMFFNWTNHGVQTGLAIHAATDEGVGLLGMRASAGCVRLSLENARTLFSLVRDNYKGAMPKLAFDKYTSTTMNNGLVLHDQSGNVELTPGYSVLVYIDEYGGENLEAKAY
jgi:lipoprotein-anchoring transpeptidase ErfK/SrfK